MILSNVAMQEAMDDGRLVIDPRPLPLRPAEGQACPYDTHTVNLRLGNEISIPQGGPFNFDLMQGGSLSSFLSKNAEKVVIPAGGYALERFEFVLGLTLEYIALPIEHDLNRSTNTCLAARVEGRSSVARCGVLATSPRRPFTRASTGRSPWRSSTWARPASCSGRACRSPN